MNSNAIELCMGTRQWREKGNEAFHLDTRLEFGAVSVC